MDERQLVSTPTTGVGVRLCFVPVDGEPKQLSRLAEHARHLGAVAARLGSKELPAQRRHVLGDVGGGSTLTFFLRVRSRYYC